MSLIKGSLAHISFFRSDYSLMIYPKGNFVDEFRNSSKDSAMGKLWDRDLKGKYHKFNASFDGLTEDIVTMGKVYFKRTSRWANILASVPFFCFKREEKQPKGQNISPQM